MATEVRTQVGLSTSACEEVVKDKTTATTLNNPKGQPYTVCLHAPINQPKFYFSTCLCEVPRWNKKVVFYCTKETCLGFWGFVVFQLGNASAECQYNV